MFVNEEALGVHSREVKCGDLEETGSREHCQQTRALKPA